LLPVDERDGDFEGADALGVALPEVEGVCVPELVPLRRLRAGVAR
jgi:hypothetical protein